MGLRVWSHRLVTSGIGNSGSLYRSGHRMGLQQDANPRVSLAAADLSTRTRRHRSWDHSNDRRTLVINSLDDGRSSQEGAPGFAIALNSRANHRPSPGTSIAILRVRGRGYSSEFSASASATASSRAARVSSAGGQSNQWNSAKIVYGPTPWTMPPTMFAGSSPGSGRPVPGSMAIALHLKRGA